MENKIILEGNAYSTTTNREDGKIVFMFMSGDEKELVMLPVVCNAGMFDNFEGIRTGDKFKITGRLAQSIAEGIGLTSHIEAYKIEVLK